MFYVGQKVVCIAANESDPQTPLTLGAVYTVWNILLDDGLLLVEVNAPEPFYGFNGWRFRPAHDIQQFRDIAEKARKSGRVTVKA